MRRLIEANDHFSNSGFAAAGLSDQRDRPSRWDLKTDPIHSFHELPAAAFQ
jgi:hypothetical protein